MPEGERAARMQAEEHAIEAAAATPVVALRGADVRMDGRRILDRVDLEIHAGEIVTVVGPNGAGKTTLARLALGLLRPSEGRVERMPGMSVGYVPQKLALDWTLPLDVERLMRLTRRAPRSAVRNALAETGAAHLAERPVQALSGGELQRVLLARALLGKPHLLVLDEPVQGVDFEGEVALYELIARIRDERGCAILLISHDIHMVMRQTDRVICLNGHVCCSGVPEAVTRHPAFLRLFGPRAAQTLALYSHAHDHSHAPGACEAGHPVRDA